MPTRPLKFCSTPGCPNRVEYGKCPACKGQTMRAIDQRRGRPEERGYDWKWKVNARRFLSANPACIDCGAPAEIADHAPVSRRDLIARGDPNPDAWHHLQPRCRPCDSRRRGNEGIGFGRKKSL